MKDSLKDQTRKNIAHDEFEPKKKNKKKNKIQDKDERGLLTSEEKR